MTLWFFAVAILPEVLIAMLVLRPVLAAKMRRENVKAVLAGEWDQAIERIVAPVRADLKELQGSEEAGGVKEEIAGLREEWGEFADLVKRDLAAIPDTVRGTVLSMQGVEQREIQAMIVESGGDLEESATMLETIVASDPEMAIKRAMAKLAAWEPSEKWKTEHELLALATEIGKGPLIAHLEGMLLGTGPTIMQGGGRRVDRRALPNPYGG